MAECLDRKGFIGYYRVSTDRQGRSGLGLDAQREAVHNFLAERSHTLIAEKIEVESGRNADRPELAKAFALCRLHRATLIIAKLDRLARSVAFVSNILESGVDFIAADFPEANRLTIHILSAVAEHEARMISERTKAALKAAKARGVVLGGDRGNLPTVAARGARASAAVRSQKAAERARDLAPLICSLRDEGRSFEVIAGELRDRGISAARGGLWTGQKVSRLMRRASQP
ncbi:DNA invertase Pin-like site-specific DNA recombinase [Sphingomonas vulcanisoli]|uniref:DNA invertase Pin-like site-specific DNA recombinase n=1 Tax=Sphingomonas vulcanisoli TaxID=1658060 RepID=A0ABX0TRU3_9SPHN|nr:recombinase family protein [Sphingomonas vulcanisoli]NIJ08243.1 DNA invertase Pin-like site-specific DNA recombinase [Sphingomonas vulcanisoli]